MIIMKKLLFRRKIGTVTIIIMTIITTASDCQILFSPFLLIKVRFSNLNRCNNTKMIIGAKVEI